MCFQAIPAALAAMGGAGAAAGGAAAAGGLGATLSTVGTLVSAGAAIVGGVNQARASSYQAKLLDQQRQTEAQLSAIEEDRTKRRFRTQIAQQRGELAARGVALDSPTAILLGESAAREMTFAAQEVRNRGGARRAELTGAASAARARGRQALLGGGLSAASTVLSAAPELWPGLYNRQVAPE
jgi:hypothetical protein